MSRMKNFNLPDLGEGLTEGEILKWLVAPGDEVKLNQPIVEVETAKAAVEIPSPYAGVVTELMHGEGDTIDVGTPIITFDTEPGAGPAPGSEPAPVAGATELESAPPSPETLASVEVAGEEKAVEPGLIGGPAPGGRTSVLVGYGPKTVTAQRRPRKAPAPEAPLEDPDLALLPSIPDSLHGAAKPMRHGGLEMGRAAERAAEAASAPVRAKPPVRKLARDLGLDLASVHPTGPSGTITRDDVQRAAQHAAVPSPASAALGLGGGVVSPFQSAPVPVWDAGREQRLPIKGVRKLTAEAMVSSAFTAPHVTEFLTVDVTRTMRAVARLKSSPEFANVRVNPLLLVAKAMILAVGRHPMINSSWDAAAGEIVVKEYVNLGIAAATPRGLIVPNIKDAGRLSLRQLADALSDLVTTAKDGKTAPADMQGGTITITNVGVFGVDTGTPILNPGEAAILCFGAVREQPWVHKGKVRVRQVSQLSLSFDHRLVDGELGSRFLADVGRFLEDPEAAILAWT
jgi:pyruvate dehydrogenase E2 component (dihydrolipoamide acetyltransferase)